jgi:glutamate-5-semialdehyde dehydrogenase
MEKGQRARRAAMALANLSTQIKNDALRAMAAALRDRSPYILEANTEDVRSARERSVSDPLIDRLMLSEERLEGMIKGLRQVADLPDPIGEVLHGWRRPNGLEILRVRVPIGVIGMIYESRPNVTVDAAALCLKSGNAVILRGGSDAINSNRALTHVIATAAEKSGVPAGAIQLIENTDRASARALMEAHPWLDLLIPRGGAGLIQSVVENAKVPVVETGVGNCHLFVDATADLDMAARIAFNAKVQRPGVCNAIETLLVHAAVAEEFLPRVSTDLRKASVELRGCPRTRAILPDVVEATEQDWHEEYLALILAVKVVDSVDEAIEHINTYGTKHSEAILTRDEFNARKFTQGIDAAALYVNASTRFTDGFEFGLGAEIGISTQKLHARGPMGLEELTSCKYIIHGTGQIRT